MNAIPLFGNMWILRASHYDCGGCGTVSLLLALQESLILIGVYQWRL